MPLSRSVRRTLRRTLVAGVAGVLLVAGAAGTAVARSGPGRGGGQGASSSYNGLALTPPMGFNDWNAYACNVSQQLIEQTALAMHRDGMQAAGYDYVNIDDCWMRGRDVTGAAAKIAAGRDAAGHLVADPTYFPDGIAAVAKYVHSLGLKLGIYEDIGTATCQGLAGSYGHEATDAKDFARWGVDYVKYDNCNLPAAIAQTPAGYEKAYKVVSNALRAAGRPIVYSLCEHTGVGQSWLWGATQSNLWRTTSDIRPNFASMLANFTTNSALGQYAGPGHWNDPDMLEVGTGKITALAAPTRPGDRTIDVDSISSAIVGAPITVGSATDHSLETGTVASVGTAATNTTLFSAAAKGDSVAHVAAVTGFAVGDPITIDGDHVGTVTSVGTAGATGTLLTAAAPGDTDLHVTSTAGAVVGQPITVDSGGATETPTVTAVGTPATSSMLAAPSLPGDTTLHVAAVSGFQTGDRLQVDSTPDAETVTVTAVGTAGATGTGLTVSPALALSHNGGTTRGALVADLSQPGTGITVSPALRQAHAAGAPTSAAGTGIGFAPALTAAHAKSAVVVGATGTGITLTGPLHRAHAAGAGVGINGMTVPESRTEMSLWAMEAAPLIAGTDLVDIAPVNRAIYENRGVIAVDQDRLGTQAYVLSDDAGHWILVKPLADGSKAVALFDADDTPWTGAQVSAAALGLDSRTAHRVSDLWSGRRSTLRATLPLGSIAPHATVLLRIGR